MRLNPQGAQHPDTPSEDARVSAVKELLNYQLGLSDSELEKIKINETKLASKDDVIYCAIEDKDTIKQLYYRKADSRNDDIIIRNYIPPQLHARFMTLNREFSDR